LVRVEGSGWQEGGGWIKGEMPGGSQSIAMRACGARPSRGRAKVGWPSGEGPEITREVVLSEGRGLRARIVGPY
jgi:hypothetical protein